MVKKHSIAHNHKSLQVSVGIEALSKKRIEIFSEKKKTD